MARQPEAEVTPAAPRGERSSLRALLKPRRPRTVRGIITAVVLMTTAIALLVAGLAMLRRDLGEYRTSWASDLATEASIVALATAPALEFDDHDVAERNLTALQARSAVLAAGLYTADGRLYAQYVRPGEQPPPAQMQSMSASAEISGERVDINVPVVHDQDQLGFVLPARAL